MGGLWANLDKICECSFFPFYPAEGQSSIQRHWDDYSPIEDLTSTYLVCNHPGSYAEKYANITAGEEVKAYYPGWPHNIGPVIVWMAYCGSEFDACSSFNGTGNHWFKINQVGLMEGTIETGLWGQGHLQASNYTWNVTIPETLQEGAYLMRHELISLHVPFGPQFYPECAHLYVKGAGTEVPGEEYLATLPGVWTADGETLFFGPALTRRWP